MNKEIGSEFWDIPLCREPNQLFEYDYTNWFISGTAALTYIIKDILANHAVRSALIPSWCCSCMIKPFIENGIAVNFYPVYIDREKRLVCDYSNARANDITLAMSYFGYTSERQIGDPSGIIIRDVTHSLFTTMSYPADYYFGSLRKWAGFWTGGFAYKSKKWTDSFPLPAVNQNYINLRSKAMSKKVSFLRGESLIKKHLDLFEEAEEYLDVCGIEAGSERDIEAVKMMDIEYMRNQRLKNAECLLDSLSDYAIFSKVSDDDCPLFVPIMLPNRVRDSLKQFLISKDIYCPTHWPISKLHNLSGETKQFYDCELSIVCDQRYDLDDMCRIIDSIREFGLI